MMTVKDLNLNVLKESLKVCADSKARIKAAGAAVVEVQKSAQEVAKNATALRELSRGEKSL